MELGVRLAAHVIVCLSIFAFASQGQSQTHEGKQLVKAELLADTTTVVPGKPFTAGLLVRMAPGWHTYWKFSGDAGLPTEVKWKLPKGWKIGEIQWPIPQKTNDPGDIQTYGYQDEVLLMQKITPPEKIDNYIIPTVRQQNCLRTQPGWFAKRFASPETRICSSICQDQRQARQRTPRNLRVIAVCFLSIGREPKLRPQIGSAGDLIFG